jgi:hypothetical protein
MFERGWITGAMPKEANEKAAWDLAGKKPYSVKIGDNWVGLRSLGPAAASLFMGAAIRKGFDEGENTTDALSKGVTASTQFLTQQTYLQSIGNLVDAAQGEPGRLGRQAVSTLVPSPAFIGQVNRATDPYVRDEREFGDQLKAKLPLGHLYAPTPRRVGPAGPLPRKTAAERFSSVASPVPITRSRDDADLKELRRLGVSFGVPPRTIKGEGKVAEIPRAEWEAFVTKAGSETLAELRAILIDPEFQPLSDSEKKEVLDKVVEQIRKKYRDPMKEGILAAAVPRRQKVRR